MSEQIANRILVIDDESTHRILAKEYLEEAGYIVRLAEDAKRGLKLAMNTKPDLVLVDLMMPGMDGFEICQHLKAAEATAHVPVVLITASRESDVIARGFEVGVDDFVTKPVDWTFIADRVGLVLAIAQKKRHDLAEKEEMERQLQSVQVQAEQESRLGGSAISSANASEQAAGSVSEAALGLADADVRIRAVRQSAEAEMLGLEARYDAQMQAQQAEARAMIEAAAMAARRELEGAHLAHAKALMVARREFDATLEEEREKARFEVEAERTRAEQAIAAVHTEIENAVRAAGQDAQVRYDAACRKHSDELDEMRAETERRIRAIEAAAAAQLQAARAEAAGEIESLRAQVEVVSAQHALVAAGGSADDLRASLRAESDARVSACWDIAQNLGNTHLEMVKSLLEKVRSLRDDADAEAASGTRQAPNRARFIEVEKAANALSTSLGSLRLLAYMMSGKAALDETACDLGRLVRETAEKMKALAAMNKVSLRADVPDRGIFFFADEPRIAYSLLLLTMNAIRHSPHGTTVTLSVEDDASEGVRIKVTDHGVGIPQARLELLRTCLDNPVAFADEQKFGFGIPTATAIARLHGASLDIDSILGSGTVATMQLPPARRRDDPSANPEYRRSA